VVRASVLDGLLLANTRLTTISAAVDTSSSCRSASSAQSAEQRRSSNTSSSERPMLYLTTPKYTTRCLRYPRWRPHSLLLALLRGHAVSRDWSGAHCHGVCTASHCSSAFAHHQYCHAVLCHIYEHTEDPGGSAQVRASLKPLALTCWEASAPRAASTAGPWDTCRPRRRATSRTRPPRSCS